MKHRILCLLGWHKFQWFSDSLTIDFREIIEGEIYPTEPVRVPIKKATCVGAGCRETRIKFK